MVITSITEKTVDTAVYSNWNQGTDMGDKVMPKDINAALALVRAWKRGQPGVVEIKRFKSLSKEQGIHVKYLNGSYEYFVRNK